MFYLNVTDVIRSSTTNIYDRFFNSISRKHGILFYNPQLDTWNARYIALEATVKNNCRLLLFVITGETRAVASMLEVGGAVLRYHRYLVIS